LEAAVNLGSVSFSDAFGAFVEKYISDYSLKSSTARLRANQAQDSSTAVLPVREIDGHLSLASG
jgi:hypothetical protein